MVSAPLCTNSNKHKGSLGGPYQFYNFNPMYFGLYLLYLTFVLALKKEKPMVSSSCTWR